MGLLAKLFAPEQRELANYQSQVEEINQLEPELEKLSDQKLQQAASQLKQTLSAETVSALADHDRAGEEAVGSRRRIINQLTNRYLPKAYAIVREASKRTIKLRPYDVQLIGGIVLNEGRIAEMKTGEGKTLVASLPLVLNAMTGRGAHLVTVNDYLARRDAGWMGRIYHLLGLTVGVIGPQFSLVYDPDYVNSESDWRLTHLKPVSREEAYRADITYGTGNEFGFDYLRDNMATGKMSLVQGELAYAIVDEVDSILIDEARTPLIISAPSTQAADTYGQFARVIPKLTPGNDYTLDEKAHSATLTDAGISRLEGLLAVGNLYDPANYQLVHYLNQSLIAYALYQKNRDYVVKEGEIVIVDQFTGRLLAGRRFNEGLHQAIEAKEGVAVKEESLTLATVTFPNYFRQYDRIAGMTGTAATEAEEFAKIYGLEVVPIPTHRPMVRLDRQDEVYKTETAKFQAITKLVAELNKNGQPVLIGTISITKSESLAKFLKAAGLKPTVLNAKQHQREGEVISQAGSPGAVTVATNMAGRGVDIVLGGAEPTDGSAKQIADWQKSHQGVVELGGLFVIGTERHESRRIDNQLRGRAARQGDPGVSQFFLSMEDDLMRIFGGERLKNLMERFHLPDDMSINNKLISRSIEQAQSRVEGHNFDIRKHLLEYDDVMNKHRQAIYSRRRTILLSDSQAAKKRHDQILSNFTPEESKQYLDKIKDWRELIMHEVEKTVSLRVIDSQWVEHLRTMEELRHSIELRGYGQREPLVEYKQEAYRLFQELRNALDAQIGQLLLHLRLEINPSPPPEATSPNKKQLNAAGGEEPSAGSATRKTGRNDPCPCGAVDEQTGKVYKYKKCGLINAAHHRS
ncbi:MAG: preprotein translocase subunit SecA [Patescibacteria group bacterium]